MNRTSLTGFRLSFLLLSPIILIAAPLHAAQVVQTFSMPLTPTDITGSLGTGTFDYFQSSGAPFGAVLTSVGLRIEVTETLQSLSVTNNDANNSQTFSYISYSNLGVVGTAPNVDKASLDFQLFLNGGINGDIDLIDTGPVLYGAGQTINYAPPAINATGDSGLVGANSIVPYDTTGSFTLGFTTTTFQAFVGGGGNGSNNQSTDAVGTVTVIYNYTVVPEPSSVALGALGACGLALVGWRRRRNG